MDREAALAAYNQRVRRNPSPGPSGTVEREEGVVRVIGSGWAGITWSDLRESGADAAIAAQIERFAELGHEWEWKHYSYDRPADLPARLLAAGLRAGPTEALLIAETGTLSQETEPPEGVEVAVVTDRDEVRTMLALQLEVFGDEPPGLEAAMLGGLASEPPGTVGLLALVAGRAVAAGRVEFEPGSDFAGMWGGCTHPDWRGRGIFRALVARGAGLAAARGYPWLHADAVEMSRPTLLRLGFTELAETTPYLYSP